MFSRGSETSRTPLDGSVDGWRGAGDSLGEVCILTSSRLIFNNACGHRWEIAQRRDPSGCRQKIDPFRYRSNDEHLIKGKPKQRECPGKSFQCSYDSKVRMCQRPFFKEISFNIFPETEKKTRRSLDPFNFRTFTECPWRWFAQNPLLTHVHRNSTFSECESWSKRWAPSPLGYLNLFGSSCYINVASKTVVCGLWSFPVNCSLTFPRCLLRSSLLLWQDCRWPSRHSLPLVLRSSLGPHLPAPTQEPSLVAIPPSKRTCAVLKLLVYV